MEALRLVGAYCTQGKGAHPIKPIEQKANPVGRIAAGGRLRSKKGLAVQSGKKSVPQIAKLGTSESYQGDRDLKSRLKRVQKQSLRTQPKIGRPQAPETTVLSAAVSENQKT
ncbi:hypothetical protein C3941_17680 [Kaistia algarum]|nr:hypothetical protein C3941_17680 [Kaistia algarum]